MIPVVVRRIGRNLLVLFAALASCGCYYVQAARGQLEVLHKSEPIDDVVAAEDTPEELARRLQLVTRAREFSIRELGLPDNDSYRSYADLGRPFVVWNVFAAPEFSLQYKQWCFPVAGCVGYRGYFSEQDARRAAGKLAAKGFDVAVAGIPAYSTLGRFDDPVLNTMMHWDDIDLVATIFHELAHQLVYRKGDTVFNESFATVVEETGIERWLQARGSRDDLAQYRERREFRERIVARVGSARDDLESLYRQPLAPAEMRQRKQQRLNALAAELRDEFAEGGRQTPEWVTADLNNARLASIALYNDRVPELRALLADCDADLECFYGRARQLDGS